MPIHGANVEGKVVSGWIESRVGDEVALGFRLEMGRPRFDVDAQGKVDGSESIEPCHAHLQANV